MDTTGNGDEKEGKKGGGARLIGLYVIETVGG